MMLREILTRPATVETFNVDITDDTLKEWIIEQATEQSLPYLLTHSVDGVNWGIVYEQDLYLSHDAYPDFSPELTLPTLEQLRLFGPDGELFIWKEPFSTSPLSARLIINADNTEQTTFVEAIDEPQLLWGDDIAGEANGFTLLREGAEGKWHAVPLKLTYDQLPLSLVIRHYIEETDIGFQKIVFSRLVDFRRSE